MAATTESPSTGASHCRASRVRLSRSAGSLAGLGGKPPGDCRAQSLHQGLVQRGGEPFEEQRVPGVNAGVPRLDSPLVSSDFATVSSSVSATRWSRFSGSKMHR